MKGLFEGDLLRSVSTNRTQHAGTALKPFTVSSLPRRMAENKVMAVVFLALATAQMKVFY